MVWIREQHTCEKCNGHGIIEYSYDDWDKMSAKQKLGYLKFEEEGIYLTMSKEEKKEYIKYGYYPCNACDGLGYTEEIEFEIK